MHTLCLPSTTNTSMLKESGHASREVAETGSRKLAPHAWHTTYNSEFRPRFEAYCDGAIGRIPRKQRPPVAKMLELLEETIYTAPEGPEFKYLRFIHNCFCRMCTAVLNSDAPGESHDLLKKLRLLSGDVWEVFMRRRMAPNESGSIQTKTSFEESVWQHAMAIEEEYDGILRRGAASLSKEVEARLASAPDESAVITPDEFKRELDELMHQKVGK